MAPMTEFFSYFTFVDIIFTLVIFAFCWIVSYTEDRQDYDHENKQQSKKL